MPASKYAIQRYHIINKCLTNKQKTHWTLEEFVCKLEEHDIRVTTRTVAHDIEMMRHDKALGYKARIIYGKDGYHYEDPNYSIDAINLSEEQLKSFNFVLDFLHEYQDLKIMEEFRAAIDKLAGMFAEFINPTSTPVIEFEKAPYYKGIELRTPILEAIRAKQVLTIHYTTFGRSYPIKHIIHPYRLKEYKNRWYLVGLLQSRKNVISLALDRMNKIEKTTTPYVGNTLFSSEDYFKNFLGITHTEGEVQDIVLSCNASLANYIKTQHIHESQEIIHEDKNGIHIRLKLIPNYELISIILGYGKDMTVLQPLQLRDQVKQTLIENLKQYEKE